MRYHTRYCLTARAKQPQSVDLTEGSFNGPSQTCLSQYFITYSGHDYSDWPLLFQHRRCDVAICRRIVDGGVRARRWWRPWRWRRWSRRRRSRWCPRRWSRSWRRWSRSWRWPWTRLWLRSRLWLWRRLLCSARLLLGWPGTDLSVTRSFRRTNVNKNGAVCDGTLHHFCCSIAGGSVYRGSVVAPIRY